MFYVEFFFDFNEQDDEMTRYDGIMDDDKQNPYSKKSQENKSKLDI